MRRRTVVLGYRDVFGQRIVRRERDLCGGGVMWHGTDLRDDGDLLVAHLCRLDDMRIGHLRRRGYMCDHEHLSRHADVFRNGNMHEWADLSEQSDLARYADVCGYDDLHGRIADLWCGTHLFWIPDLLWDADLPWRGLLRRGGYVRCDCDLHRNGHVRNRTDLRLRGDLLE